MENHQIEINPAAWSAHAAGVLSEVGNADDYKAQVKRGAKLFRVSEGENEIGFYLLRVDKNPSGAEGVLVAAVGRDKNNDLTEVILPVIERQFFGCKSIRIHTQRPGLAKKLSRAGYGAAEMVLRKPL